MHAYDAGLGRACPSRLCDHEPLGHRRGPLARNPKPQAVLISLCLLFLLSAIQLDAQVASAQVAPAGGSPALPATDLQPAADEFRGDVSCPPGSRDGNLCVPDVVGSVNALPQDGNALGFRWSAHQPFVNGLSSHWQGIQRLFVPAAGLCGRHFVVTSNHLDSARAALVYFGSAGADGRPLGPNRGSTRPDPTGRPGPPPEDRIIRSPLLSEQYRHPGGIQAIGAYVVVPLEGGNEGQRRASVSCFRLTSSRVDQAWTFPVDSRGAPAAAVTRLQDGRYLMAVATKGTHGLDFYVGDNPTLSDPRWRHLASWHQNEVRSVLPGERGRIWDRYQSLNLVTQCEDGSLFLLAFAGPVALGIRGPNRVDAYRLRLTGTGEVSLTKVASRSLHCSRQGLGQLCQMRAGAGVYVDPDHRLVVYVTDRDIQGPFQSVNMVEFPSPVSTSSSGDD
jgi:hypothetical protein